MIREIEELFVYKVPIYKLVLNCFIQFFGDLELLERAEPEKGVERLNGVMVAALDCFRQNKDVRRHWVELHGPSFGVYKAKGLGPNFSEKCLIKTKKLAERMGGVAKYTYLINNFYAFREHTTVVSGSDLKAQIDKNCQIIVGLWRINIEAVEDYQLSNYLKGELRKHRKYYLPEELRAGIAGQLKSILEELMAREAVHGDFEEINDGVDRVYTGE